MRADPGDTDLLQGEHVDRLAVRRGNGRLAEENRDLVEAGGKPGKPACQEPLLPGTTEASLTTDSSISAASLQETIRVLTTRRCAVPGTT